MPRQKPFHERLVLKETTGCMEFEGGRDKDGYGMIAVSTYGESRAHRYAYKHAFGSIPAGAIVRHTCDNPPCCNPAHLVAGTHQDNMDDKAARNRAPKGEAGSRAKLTNEMVKEIRELYAAGVTQTEIASRFPVTQSSVSLIVLRKQWKHI